MVLQSRYDLIRDRHRRIPRPDPSPSVVNGDQSTPVQVPIARRASVDDHQVGDGTRSVTPARGSTTRATRRRPSHLTLDTDAANAASVVSLPTNVVPRDHPPSPISLWVRAWTYDETHWPDTPLHPLESPHVHVRGLQPGTSAPSPPAKRAAPSPNGYQRRPNSAAPRLTSQHAQLDRSPGRKVPPPVPISPQRLSLRAGGGSPTAKASPRGNRVATSPTSHTVSSQAKVWIGASLESSGASSAGELGGFPPTPSAKHKDVAVPAERRQRAQSAYAATMAGEPGMRTQPPATANRRPRSAAPRPPSSRSSGPRPSPGNSAVGFSTQLRGLSARHDGGRARSVSVGSSPVPADLGMRPVEVVAAPGSQPQLSEGTAASSLGIRDPQSGSDNLAASASSLRGSVGVASDSQGPRVFAHGSLLSSTLDSGDSSVPAPRRMVVQPPKQLPTAVVQVGPLGNPAESADTEQPAC